MQYYKLVYRAEVRSAEHTALCTSRNGYQITVIADYLLLWYCGTAFLSCCMIWTLCDARSYVTANFRLPFLNLSFLLPLLIYETRVHVFWLFTNHKLVLLVYWHLIKIILKIKRVLWVFFCGKYMAF